MDQNAITLTVLGMALATYVPRLLPVWVLSTRPLPPLIAAWLRHVPVAVLAAMLSTSLLVQDGQGSFRADSLFLWAALPTFLVAWKTRSLFGPLIVGMAVVAIARYVVAL